MPELNAVVTQKIEVTPELIILRLVPLGMPLPDFTPGQFAVVGLPGTAPRVDVSDDEEPPADPEKIIRRAYSIASSSVAREYLELYVTLVRSGQLTPRLFALEPKDRVWLGPKFTGAFTLSEVPKGNHVVLIATGTGLAPYMSMLRTELTCGAPERYAVLHGARHSWDLGYRSELRTLQRMCGNFTYLPIVSRPDEEAGTWAGATGHVQSLWTTAQLSEAWGFRPTPDDTHVFLCGNPAMIEDMIGILAAEGFVEHTRHSPGQVHVERYW